ncbi:MAG: cation:proton antiporter, partial [Acidobacteriota bacterium]|nr:cation:proton antiporter [Acidobacteriota bacterium]
MTLEHLLHEGVLILGGAVIVVLVAARLRIPPLVGLLITGMVIGPSGLGWVAQTEEVEAFAEIGVALLLFAIGLELSLGKLKELRRPFLVGGSIQAAITAVLVGGGAAIMGQSAGPAIFFGCAVALSSTAIVLKLLDERREGETPHGQIASDRYAQQQADSKSLLHQATSSYEQSLKFLTEEDFPQKNL